MPRVYIILRGDNNRSTLLINFPLTDSHVLFDSQFLLSSESFLILLTASSDLLASVPLQYCSGHGGEKFKSSQHDATGPGKDTSGL